MPCQTVYLDPRLDCPGAINAQHAVLIALDSTQKFIAHIPTKRSLHYRFEDIKIPYLSQHNVDVLIYYTNYKAGGLLIFKEGVFTKEWNADAGCVTNEGTYVLNLVAVFYGDKVAFHAVSLTDYTLYELWIAKHLFNGLLKFDSEHDKLRIEQCILLYKTSDPCCASKYKRRYEKVCELLHDESSSDSDSDL